MHVLSHCVLCTMLLQVAAMKLYNSDNQGNGTCDFASLSVLVCLV